MKLVLDISEADRTKVALAGGKGASLGELFRIEGIRVPDGFCVSTDAYRQVVDGAPSVAALIARLSRLGKDDRGQIAELSTRIRTAIESLPVPDDLAGQIAGQLSKRGEEDAYAVRSSATAEDLPTASFAGQQDTFLDVVGLPAILKAVSRCWASLFTARAAVYRIQNGFDHRKVQLAVVVQRMVAAETAGILFTAHPVSGDRKVASIDAGFGLGDALVAGHVNADNYTVRDGRVTGKRIAGARRALSDAHAVQLAAIGRRIEAHFGQPQDIEWCRAGGELFIVQSRPITTLFPVPVESDGENHVYVSVGHQQMMTDAILPLGLSFFLHITRAPMREAGGRLFVDVTPSLASASLKQKLISALGRSDPLIKDALTTVVRRTGFVKPSSVEHPVPPTLAGGKGMTWTYLKKFEEDRMIVPGLVQAAEASNATAEEALRSRTGTDVFDFIREDIPRMQKVMFDPQLISVILVAMHAAAWLNKNMLAWLGEKNAADTLSLSAPNNVTSEMGLELLDVADAIRPHPDVVARLERGEIAGAARTAIDAFLARYGARCAGEIDITRARWNESPQTLIPAILGNIRSFAPGASRAKFEAGRRAAHGKEAELLARLHQLPDGPRKARHTKRMIDLLRNLIGYREYPKYSWVCRYWIYKQAMLREVDALVRESVLSERDDAYYLSFDELREAVRTRIVDRAIIARRRDDYWIFETLTPPRVLTSDGERLDGNYKRKHLPAGAIAGLAVSSGVVEGRARVILKMEDARLEEGDILVTTFTDPSWTPLFVAIKGLVTEVGGLMTHGAVIAREYGLPAVVAVGDATQLIQDGQRIRVNGTDGYVEML